MYTVEGNMGPKRQGKVFSQEYPKYCLENVWR